MSIRGLTELLSFQAIGLGDESASSLRGNFFAKQAKPEVTVALMSDRVPGAITSLASIVKSASAPIRIVLIGEKETNAEVEKHFEGRVKEFISITMEDIESDLIEQGMNPIWTWDEWHSSMEPGWKNKNTLHMAGWDGHETHAHELNHLRFYLPHLSALKETENVFFIDDDILVNRDLSEVAEEMSSKVDSKTGLTCPCNYWKWDNSCAQFEFQSEQYNIAETSSLYMGEKACEFEWDENCIPENYQSFIEAVLPGNNTKAEDQTAWNFGFCMMHNDNWRQLELTDKYENAMRLNYELHEVPETSLAFGLGIPLLALAGSVACWDEDVLKVRDGFGFIEWEKYQSTFGEDVFSNVDVAHYTGEMKPWMAETTIDQHSLEPWLNVMEEEGIEIPVQLPEKPSDQIFQVLTSQRAGANFVMKMLAQHPEVCAEGEGDRVEVAFPVHSMNMNGLSYLPTCSVKKGCTLEFVMSEVLDMTYNLEKGEIPQQCRPGYNTEFDLPEEHLRRLCNFAEALDGEYTKEALLVKWVEAFAQEDSDFLGCKCPRGTTIKGMTVQTDWIAPKANGASPSLPNLDETQFKGSKVIRLKRESLLERYVSILVAQQTGKWHAKNLLDKMENSDVRLTIDVDQMVAMMKRMEEADVVADAWATEHASEVMWVDFEECRSDAEKCRREMWEFLGADESKAPSVDTGVVDLDIRAEANPLRNILNRDEVIEALSANGFGQYVGVDDHKDIELLIYETNPEESSYVEKGFMKLASELKGLTTTVFGQGTPFRGFGSKYHALLPVLEDIDPESLVVVSDSRDVLINVHSASKAHLNRHLNSYKALSEFRRTFDDLTKNSPNSVVLSTEAQCCVNALTHIAPGDLFGLDGSRSTFACSSGEDGCKWLGREKALPWHKFQMSLSKSRDPSSNYDDVYLNAGLMAGKAKDLLKIISDLQMQELEDDQAVWTDYLYTFPNSIVLDYKQQMFGNNRWLLGEEGCVFDADETEGDVDYSRLVHRSTGTTPLFVHSPGQFVSCHEALFQKLMVQGLDDGSVSGEVIEIVESRFLQDAGGGDGDGNYAPADTGGGSGLISVGEDAARCEDGFTTAELCSSFDETVPLTFGSAPPPPTTDLVRKLQMVPEPTNEYGFPGEIGGPSPAIDILYNATTSSLNFTFPGLGGLDDTYQLEQVNFFVGQDPIPVFVGGPVTPGVNITLQTATPQAGECFYYYVYARYCLPPLL